MPSGTVKKWVEEKGFGFLLPDGRGNDVFVHRSALVGLATLMPGDRVTYDAEDDGKGRGKLKAANVILISSGNKSERSGDLFEDLPPADLPPSSITPMNGVDFFLQQAGNWTAALSIIEPFIIKSSLGCPFLAISDRQLVATIRAPSSTEFRHLLGLTSAYITGCETACSTFTASFGGEMLGHGGELSTAVFQLTYSVDAGSLAPTPVPPGAPTAMGLLVDARSEMCTSLLRHIMESPQITKIMWDAERVCESLMYQEQPCTMRIQPVAVVDAKVAFNNLPLESMLIHVRKRLLRGLPRTLVADVDEFQANNQRVVALPLSYLSACQLVDDVHRIEAALRSKAPPTGAYAEAAEATDRMLHELRSDPNGLKTLGQLMGWFESSSGLKRTASAVAIRRHILSLRHRGADLGPERGVVEEMNRDVAAELVRAGVDVPEDLSFSLATPLPPPDVLSAYFPCQ